VDTCTLKNKKKFILAGVVLFILLLGASLTLLTIKRIQRQNSEILFKYALSLSELVDVDRNLLSFHSCQGHEFENSRFIALLDSFSKSSEGIIESSLFKKDDSKKIFSISKEVSFKNKTASLPQWSKGDIPPDLKEVFETFELVVSVFSEKEKKSWYWLNIPIKDPKTQDLLAVLRVLVDARFLVQHPVLFSLPSLILTLLMLVLVFVWMFLYKNKYKTQSFSRLSFWLKNFDFILIALAGLAILVVVAHATDNKEQHRRKMTFYQLAQNKTDVMVESLRDISDFELESLLRFFEGSEVVTVKEFEHFTQYLSRNPIVHAWKWISLVKKEGLKEFKDQAREMEIENIKIWHLNFEGKKVESKDSEFLYPVVHVVPPDKKEWAIGYNLGLIKELGQTFSEAIHGRSIAASSPVLIKPWCDSPLVFVVLPVYGEGCFTMPEGFVSAAICFEALLETVKGDDFVNIDVGMLNKGSLNLIVSDFKDQLLTNSLFLSRPVSVFGKIFILNTYAGQDFVRLYPARAAMITFITGLPLVLAMAFVVCLVFRRRDELEGLVKERTTDLVKTQEQLIQAQKMESIGRLAGGVAHDFNNMLGVILGYVDIALDKVHSNDPVCSDLKEIENAATRSANLTGQLLTFARKQNATPRAINLNKLVESMLSMLRRVIGENIELVWLPGSDLGTVRIDPVQVDQILVNLCVNSKDAITGLGKIEIKTQNIKIENTSAEQFKVPPGLYVLLCVKDNGCGMNSDTLDKLFEPFFTTKEAGKGTGLGLCTVYGIVSQNNGFVNVFSSPDKGAVFKIYLPYYEGEPVPLIAEKQITITDKYTILLVEDEPMILKMTATMLKQQGHQVVSAATPEEAINFASDKGYQIDLLLTDIMMPQMNGKELFDTILPIRKNIKCLFMSGYSADIISEQGFIEEDVCFVQKPFTVKDLAEAISKTMT
jgi:signal transduction histidine kinase/CheY-like chemotaxis protein